jgi:uridine kinase
MTIDQIAAQIKQAKLTYRPRLIAIEGYGGSGKTTIAENLMQELQSCYVVHMDDFIIRERLSDISADKPGFSRSRLKSEVLNPIITNQEASYRRLLWDSNTLSEPIEIPRVDYVIVEGISSFHPDIEEYYDFKIWVDTPITEATSRGRARDTGNENEDKWSRWAKNDLMYESKYHPKQRADFTIEN